MFSRITQFIKENRIRLGLISERSGMDRTMVSKYLNGKLDLKHDKAEAFVLAIGGQISVAFVEPVSRDRAAFLLKYGDKFYHDTIRRLKKAWLAANSGSGDEISIGSQLPYPFFTNFVNQLEFIENNGAYRIQFPDGFDYLTWKGKLPEPASAEDVFQLCQLATMDESIRGPKKKGDV